MGLKYKKIRATTLGVLASCMAVSFAAAPTDALAADCNSPAGHEGDVRYDTTNKNFYYCNGSVWAYFGGQNPPSFGHPLDIKATNISHNGNFYAARPAAINGFHAINQWAQDNGCAGYKVCTVRDVISYMRAGNEIPAVVKGSDVSAWLNMQGSSQSVWSYMNCQNISNPDSKYDVWSSAASSRYGQIIAVYDADPPTSQLIVPMTTCDKSHRVLCCRY